MADRTGRVTRRHKSRKSDGKGVRLFLAGERFRVPAGVSSIDAELRFLLIHRLWADNEGFCRRHSLEMTWTYIALWAAERIRLGVPRIPLPPIDDVLASFGDSNWPRELQVIVDERTDETLRTLYPSKIDDLYWDEGKAFFEFLCDSFPSVNWLLPESHAGEVISFHEKQARSSIERLAQAKNQAPPHPSTPLIQGTFHEALSAFEVKRKDDFTSAEGFDNSGHHMVGLVQKMRERMSDFPLAELDLSRCQAQFDFWRKRPRNLISEEIVPLTVKTCENYIGELGRFFDWLHLSSQFAWRKPADFETLERRVESLNSDRRSVKNMEVLTFSIDNLVLLMKHATPFERFLLVWCLNCSHGAAEMGRVEWGDIFLRREHPWKKQGLRLDTTENDSWCGFVRPKSDVLGWWLLWPETVQLLEWWKGERSRILGDTPPDDERVLVTETGSPLYRDESRNAQTGFANTWNRLLDRIERVEGKGVIERLPFGTLRDQLSDWLGGDQARAVVASVALCHGILHRDDKLLYGRYSNRPWQALFQSQREYRQYLARVFDAVPNLLIEYDSIGEKVASLWKAGIRKIPKIAEYLDISEMTVRRRIQSLRLESPLPSDSQEPEYQRGDV